MSASPLITGDGQLVDIGDIHYNDTLSAPQALGGMRFAHTSDALRGLVRDLRDPALADVEATLAGLGEIAFPTGWAGIAAAWQIVPEAALTAYLWAWAENQVMAALKAVPLGQASGQRLLAELGGRIPAVATAALTLPESQWSNFTPAFAIACARHETQYSRLFRS